MAKSAMPLTCVDRCRYSQSFGGNGSLPYEFFSPTVPSLRWFVCSTLSRHAVSRPASTANCFVLCWEITLPSTLFDQSLPVAAGTV